MGTNFKQIFFSILKFIITLVIAVVAILLSFLNSCNEDGYDLVLNACELEYSSNLLNTCFLYTGSNKKILTVSFPTTLHNISKTNKNSKKENPVNVSIVKTEKGYDYYVGNELVNEFTNENCEEKEMDLLKYIYDTSKEELDNKPKEERTKPKKKMIVYK